MVDYTPEDTGSVNSPEGTTTNAADVGTLEFQADFIGRLANLVEASLTKRPDAISLDYLTAFCLGPVAVADTTLGVISHIWKCRVDNTLRKIYIARENDTKDGWNTETELLSFDDGSEIIDEVDIAFEQAARPVICAQRGTDSWLYWFNTVDSAFGFDNFGAGRTPRVILDSPTDTTNSDVLFFYLTATTLVYRQQRDRYAVEINTPLAVDSNTYIEDVVKLRDSRIKIELIRRDTVTGKYSALGLTSTLYPIILIGQGFIPSLVFSSATLVVVLIEKTVEVNSFSIAMGFGSALLTDPVILRTLFDKDSFSTALIFSSATLLDSIILKTLFDKDSFAPTTAFTSATLIVVVITKTLFDKDSFAPTLTFTSATLEIV